MFVLLSSIKVPEDYEVVDLIDLFFKVHRIFGLPYNAHIKQMMEFLGRHVYQDNSHPFTQRLQDLADALMGVSID